MACDSTARAEDSTVEHTKLEGGMEVPSIARSYNEKDGCYCYCSEDSWAASSSKHIVALRGGYAITRPPGPEEFQGSFALNEMELH